MVTEQRVQASGTSCRGDSVGDMPTLLEVDQVYKRFGGLEILSGVSFSVGRGEVFGLVGPNGAGKTTLFNCILGIVSVDSGKIILDGRDISNLPVWKRASLGMARTFQRLELFSGMTPREHLIIAYRTHKHSGSILKDLIGHGLPTQEELDRVASILELFGLMDVADVPVEALSLGHGRLVELARAFILDPFVLMMDEPSSGLDAVETARISDMLERLRGNGRSCAIIVEHDLDMVIKVASQIAVLDSGSIIAQGDPREVLNDPEVRKAYLGKI